MIDTTVEASPGGNDEVKRHVRKRSIWIRLIYILTLAVAWAIAEVVFIAVVVLQFLAKLFTDKPIENLVTFGRNLAEYMAEIVRFQTFVTEDLTFPFTPWPSVPEQKSSH
jgi:hypothetical protein